MKNTFTLFTMLFVFVLQSNASRALYVNDFHNILGDINAEINLLAYSQNNGIETLLLYDLHIIHSLHDLTNSSTNFILADFILNAKSNYGISNITATGENESFFSNVIDIYNNSRTSSLEKFDGYNLEFEFWDVSSTSTGGYYCNNYLIPNGLPCNTDGAFEFYLSNLQTINLLANNNIHPIITESYVGWPTAEQADSISSNLDLIRIHAYVNNPQLAFDYTENRLFDFAYNNTGLDISIIYSSEPTFMQNWLINNSMLDAEQIFINDFNNIASNWTSNINLNGFTYFAYTYNSGINLSSKSNLSKNKLKTQPNPSNGIFQINNPRNFSEEYQIEILDISGRLVQDYKHYFNQIHINTKGVFILKIYDKNGTYISEKIVIN